MNEVVDIAIDTFKFDKKINKPLRHTKKEKRRLQEVYKQEKKKKLKRFDRPVEQFYDDYVIDDDKNAEDDIRNIYEMLFDRETREVSDHYDVILPILIMYCAKRISGCSFSSRAVIHHYLCSGYYCELCRRNSFICIWCLCDSERKHFQCKSDLKTLIVDLKEKINCESKFFWTLNNSLLSDFHIFVYNNVIEDCYYDGERSDLIDKLMGFWKYNWPKIKIKSLWFKIKNYILFRSTALYWLEQSQKKHYQIDGKQRKEDMKKFSEDFLLPNE